MTAKLAERLFLLFWVVAAMVLVTYGVFSVLATKYQNLINALERVNEVLP